MKLCVVGNARIAKLSYLVNNDKCKFSSKLSDLEKEKACLFVFLLNAIIKCFITSS